MICSVCKTEYEIKLNPKQKVKKKFVRWVNYYGEAYRDPFGGFYETEEEALKQNYLDESKKSTHKIEFELEIFEED